MPAGIEADAALESSPKPDPDGFQSWQNTILEKQRAGDLVGALKTIDDMMPIYGSNRYHKLKLLMIKVQILRALKREAEAEQVELEIKKIREER